MTSQLGSTCLLSCSINISLLSILL
jgi:hypothetical protein